MPINVTSNVHFNTSVAGSGYVLPGEVGYLGLEGDLTVRSDASGVISDVGPGTWDHYYFQDGLYIGSGDGDYVFTNCIFEGTQDSWLILAFEGGTSFTFEDCTFRWHTGDTLSTNGAAAIQSLDVADPIPGITMRRCDISGKADGIQVAATSLIEDCYIHDLVWAGTVPDNTHNDGIQIYAGDLTVTGCYISVGAQAPYSNSCMFFQGADIANVTVTDTYMSGGGYSYYVQNGSHTVLRCTFGPDHLYGTHTFEGAGWTLVEWSNNVDHLGAPVNF